MKNENYVLRLSHACCHILFLRERSSGRVFLRMFDGHCLLVPPAIIPSIQADTFLGPDF